MYAGTLNLYHGEDKAENTKLVMMGHADALAIVHTDDNFYKNMPIELEKITANQKDKVNFKLSMRAEASGNSDISMNLNKTKFFMR